MENGRKQERRVAQDAEVDLLQRGKFKAGGKLLFPRKDDGTCGKRMCCFCEAEQCTKPDDVPSCIEQDIYYLDYWNRKALKADDIEKCLEGIFKRHPVLLEYQSGLRDAVIAYITCHFKTKRSWLFDTVTAGWRHFNVIDGAYDSFSLLMLAMEFAQTTRYAYKIVECTAKHIHDNLDDTLECMEILRKCYANGLSVSYDDIQAVSSEERKAKSDFERMACGLCEWALGLVPSDIDEFYAILFGHLYNLSSNYNGLLQRMHRTYFVGRVFMDGFARALREIYVDSTPKQIMLSQKAKEA